MISTCLVHQIVTATVVLGSVSTSKTLLEISKGGVVSYRLLASGQACKSDSPAANAEALATKYEEQVQDTQLQHDSNRQDRSQSTISAPSEPASQPAGQPASLPVQAAPAAHQTSSSVEESLASTGPIIGSSQPVATQLLTSDTTRAGATRQNLNSASLQSDGDQGVILLLCILSLMPR